MPGAAPPAGGRGARGARNTCLPNMAARPRRFPAWANQRWRAGETWRKRAVQRANGRAVGAGPWRQRRQGGEISGRCGGPGRAGAGTETGRAGSGVGPGVERGVRHAAGG